MRSTKTVDGVTTQHIWDGANIVMDITEDLDGNRTETVYIRGLQLIAAVETTVLQDGGRTVRTVYYLHDGRGSVVHVVGSNGIVQQSYRYTAFGEEINLDENDQNPWRHNAEYWDVETGMYYIRARYYNPHTGRFLTPDPHWGVHNMIFGDTPETDPNVAFAVNNGVSSEVTVEGQIRRQQVLAEIVGVIFLMQGLTSDEKIFEIARLQAGQLTNGERQALERIVRKPSLEAIMQSANLYVYTMNSPVMWTDPSGLSKAATATAGVSTLLLAPLVPVIMVAYIVHYEPPRPPVAAASTG